MDVINQRYQEWLDRSTDSEVNAQLLAIKDNESAKKEAFYKDLSFGTAGMRGELGAGTNCLNIYTVRKATQGVAQCMKAHGYTRASVSCDSRINSDLFARVTAEVFASNGIKTFLTRSLMPTPFLSYLTRETKSQMGVMITASHNPAKYNGYKVYGADGCQLTDAYSAEITQYIKDVDAFSVVTDTLENYLDSGMIEYASEQITANYLDEVFSHRTALADGLKVTFTPLNGAGYTLVPAILEKMQVSQLCEVDEQKYPDGNFTTCPYPNPEKADALRLGIEQAKKNDSDILIATDPDCDRVGTAVKTAEGYILLTGNEVGALLCDYLLMRKKANGTLAKNPVIVKTIVTTELVKKIGAQYNAEVFNVLTGFKYIGDVIAKLEAKGEESRYVLGFEESYGYLSGTYVRDKDAVNASMLIAEMTAYYKKQGKTLVDRLNELYEQFGYYQHCTIPFDFPGSAGIAKMEVLLSDLRKNLPDTIAGAKVVKTVDYLTQTEVDLPRANVLSFAMEDDSLLIVRPSGTEPLIKVYLTACKTKEENAQKFEKMLAWLNEIFK